MVRLNHHPRHPSSTLLSVLILLGSFCVFVIATSSGGPSIPTSPLASSFPQRREGIIGRRQTSSSIETMASGGAIEIEDNRHRRKRPENVPASAVHDDEEDDVKTVIGEKGVDSANEKVSLLKALSMEGGAAAVAASSSPTMTTSQASLAATFKTLGYFALWFALNVYYNIVNKQVLNALPLPVTIATAQLGVGSLYVLLCWLIGLRARPKPSPAGLKALWPIAWYHGSGQLFTVLSLGAAAVSFTHIVKAMEPFFSASVAAVAFKQIFKPQVYTSLIPVVVGVSVACANDVAFGWFAFMTAMASNLAFALRANYSKLSMSVFKKEDNRTMTPANVYGVVTIQAFLILLPLVIIWEGSSILPTWDKALLKGIASKQLQWRVLMSGLFHYLNNEVMYLALDNVHPITLAVGNTAKRVFIIIASLLVFRNPISLTGAIGSAVGIFGVLIYSLTKQYYDSRQ